MAHALPVLVSGWSPGRDRRVQMPLLVACRQARPVVRDLQAPCVSRDAAGAKTRAWSLRGDRGLADGLAVPSRAGPWAARALTRTSERGPSRGGRARAPYGGDLIQLNAGAAASVTALPARAPSAAPA